MLRRPAAVTRNRRAANWVLANAPWLPEEGGSACGGALCTWGYLTSQARQDACVAVARELAVAALTDGGRRITVQALTRMAWLCFCLTRTVRPPSVTGNRRWAVLAL